MIKNQTTGAAIESRKDFKSTPQGQYKYWDAEIKASQKTLMDWKRKADRIVTRYLDARVRAVDTDRDNIHQQFKLNLFHSNTATLYSMLYGNLPKVDVSRRYADSSDDIGRVAAETMERLLNCDINDNGQEYDTVLRSTLLDRLTAGLGVGRVRYEVETDVQTDSELGQVEVVTSEKAPIDYFYYQDVLWSWARSWSEVRWVAFRSYLTKDEVAERFGDELAEKVQLKQQHSKEDENRAESDDKITAWLKCEVWEIWDKQKREVTWYSEGVGKILDKKEDPLQLKDFFPCPRFFIANPTSTLFIPTPDYHLCQDLYNHIDELQTRIAVITEAVRVIGVYDSSADGLKRMFKEGLENDMIPVDNWALFAEKGGIRGQIEWVPVQDIVNTLDKLRQLRDESISLLQQISGMSDVMRGGLDNQYEGVGQSQMKAKFGSIRVQALQDEFAQFASDLMSLKAEVIARHFDPLTIARYSNMQTSPDAEMLLPAIELIKQPEEARLRIVIRPESVAMVDYAQLKQERTDYINALSMFMQSAAPLMDADPSAKPFLMKMLQWGLAGFKGAQEIEGVLDRAIEAAEQQQEQPQEQDPQAAADQAAAQMEMQKEQMKQQGELAKIQAKAQADMQLREQDKQADIETAMAQAQAKQMELQADMQAKLAEIEAKMQADLMVEQAKMQANVAQTQAGAEAEIQKDLVETQTEIQKEATKSSLKIQEIAAQNAGKIDEIKEQAKNTKAEGSSDAEK